MMNNKFKYERTPQIGVDTVDAFKDRLSQRVHDTGRPALSHQCRGRNLAPAEAALAEALMTIYGEGAPDFDAVAVALVRKGVIGPRSQRTDWTAALLAQELSAINSELDAAYAERGYGA